MTTESATKELKSILEKFDYSKYDGGLKTQYNRMNSLHSFLLSEMKEQGKTDNEIRAFFENLRGY